MYSPSFSPHAAACCLSIVHARQNCIPSGSDAGSFIRRLGFVALMALLFWLPSSIIFAAECVVADPTGTPLNYRLSPGGKVVGTLPNGLTVVTTDSEEGKWVQVALFSGDYIGYVYRPYLKCRAFRQDDTYPLIISLADLRRLGFYFENTTDTGEDCFEIGDGLISLRLSPSRLSALKAQRLPLSVFCTIVRIDGFRYHPETGERLPTIAIKDYINENPIEIPVIVPDCLKNGIVLFDYKNCYAFLSLRTCNLAFNPFTGRAASAADKAILTNQGVVVDGGAGPSPSEASLASIRGKRAATKKQIEELRKRAGQ
jgi:hypothetical protein